MPRAHALDDGGTRRYMLCMYRAAKRGYTLGDAADGADALRSDYHNGVGVCLRLYRQCLARLGCMGLLGRVGQPHGTDLSEVHGNMVFCIAHRDTA